MIQFYYHFTYANYFSSTRTTFWLISYSVHCNYSTVIKCSTLDSPGYGSNMEEIIDADYHEAHRLGEEGSDCHEAYPACPFGHGLLDLISMIET
jgi:hypothetical protein